MPESPSSDPGQAALRTAVVWDAVCEVIDRLAGSTPLTIVDVGGGTGGLAVRLAELGHHVVVIDPSPNALASLHRRAADGGVGELVRGVQGDTSDLGSSVDDGSVDVLLCHGVLDVVDEPAQALARMHAALRVDGLLSVVVPGRVASVLARALAGQFERARTLLDARIDDWRPDVHGPRRFTPSDVANLLDRGGFEVDRIDATRVFSDLVPSALVDGESGGRRALLDLERAVATSPDFEALGGQLHAVAVRRA